MDVAAALRLRLRHIGAEQRELAEQAGVSEAYISQLLSGKKAPPAPRRTEIYKKMEVFLDLPQNFLSNLAEQQLAEGLKSRFGRSPEPLFPETRELILASCRPSRRRQMLDRFAKEPFGELEQLVTQKLLDVVKGVVRQELFGEGWILKVAQLNGGTLDRTRTAVAEFLEADIYHVSSESCTLFLGPMIESWDIDLNDFSIEVTLNKDVVSQPIKKLEFVEAQPKSRLKVEPGFQRFLSDSALSGDASDEEIEFLRQLRFASRRPNPLYYYRELQNLRDPIHFVNECTRS